MLNQMDHEMIKRRWNDKWDHGKHKGHTNIYHIKLNDIFNLIIKHNKNSNEREIIWHMVSQCKQYNVTLTSIHVN